MPKKKVKKLFRSREDRVIAGVCGGLGDYFDMDSVLVRIIWVLITFLSVGMSVVLYAIMTLIVPLEPVTPSGKSVKS